MALWVGQWLVDDGGSEGNKVDFVFSLWCDIFFLSTSRQLVANTVSSSSWNIGMPL